mgnify:FL=1
MTGEELLTLVIVSGQPILPVVEAELDRRAVASKPEYGNWSLLPGTEDGRGTVLALRRKNEA